MSSSSNIIDDEGDDSFSDHVLEQATDKARVLSAIRSFHNEMKNDNNDTIIEKMSSDDLSGNRDEDKMVTSIRSESDVRFSLFNSNLEPYPHSMDFRRVIITEIESEKVDPDTIAACQSLRKCLQLREKWITAHPFPPQDRIYENAPQCETKDEVKDFRRRNDPEYNIFDQSIPDSISCYKYQMEKGVINVYRNSGDVNSDNIATISLPIKRSAAGTFRSLL